MSTTSVVETIAGRVERELAMERAARPALSSHVSRAEGIIVTHLSCRRQRVIITESLPERLPPKRTRSSRIPALPDTLVLAES